MSVSSSSMSSDTNIGSATEVLDASASESSTSSVPIVVAAHGPLRSCFRLLLASSTPLGT